MIEGLKPYPAMKDSRVPWFGEVPEHWEVVPLWAIARPKSVINQEDRALLSVYLGSGVIPFSEVQEKRTNVTSEDLSKYQAVDPGDFVLNNQQAWRGSVGVSSHKGIVSPAYLVLSLDSRIQREFANLLFREKAMVAQYLICSKGVGSIQRNLYWPYLKRAVTILPPLSEQTAIVRFLDHVERRIRRYIRSKQKLIKLLEEQKQAIIHRAVTRGLNPNVRLKPSGVEWLGDVPEHWEIATKLKYVSSLKGRLGWQGLKASEYTAIGPYVLSSAHFKNHKIEWERCPHVSEERYAMDTNIQLAEEDILLMKDGAAMGKLAFVDHLPGLACLNSHLLLFRPRSANEGRTYEPRFLYYFMRTDAFQDYVQVNGTGATFSGISQEAVGNYKICLPPLMEQREIVSFLDSETALLGEAQAKIELQIDRLREYRTRLIADVVTGKLDVREAAAGLPDEVEEPEPLDETGAEIDVEDGADEPDAAIEEAEA